MVEDPDVIQRWNPKELGIPETLMLLGPAPHSQELNLSDLSFSTFQVLRTLEYLLFFDLVYYKKIWNKLYALW